MTENKLKNENMKTSKISYKTQTNIIFTSILWMVLSMILPMGLIQLLPKSELTALIICINIGGAFISCLFFAFVVEVKETK